jgi:hypothetical protein
MSEWRSETFLKELRAKDIQKNKQKTKTKNLDLKFSLLAAMKHKNLLSFQADTIKSVDIPQSKWGKLEL